MHITIYVIYYKLAQGPHDSTQKSLKIRVNIYIDIIIIVIHP